MLSVHVRSLLYRQFTRQNRGNERARKQGKIITENQKSIKKESKPMNREYILNEDWEDFSKKYPDAQSFLLSISLKREKQFLEKELKAVPFLKSRENWLKKRLKELSTIS